MVLAMSRPKELAGDAATEGMNPEQLFAMGYASCYGQAVNGLAAGHGVDPAGASVVCEVVLNKGSIGYELGVELKVLIPGQDVEKVKKLADAAHKACPYSKAVKGNVPVVITVI